MIKFWLALGAFAIMAVSAWTVYLLANRWADGRYSLKSNRNVFFLFVIIAWASIFYSLDILLKQ